MKSEEVKSEKVEGKEDTLINHGYEKPNKDLTLTTSSGYHMASS